jgi:hypothetical protein
MTNLPIFHSLHEAAALLTEHGLQLTARWLQDNVQKSRIPYTRIANKIHFSDAQLEQIVQMHTHTPANPGDLRPAGVRRRAS